MNRDRQTINRYLRAHGLATLEDPQAMVPQLAFHIVDHEHFKRLINTTEPEYRREMYEALKPHLGFEPKPLDVYIAELGQQAETEQLPTVDRDGNFHAFRVSTVKSASSELEEVIVEILEEELSKFHLTLTCRSCTREETFHGGTRGDAIWKARRAGWTYGLDNTGRGREICPECPATKSKH